MRIRAFTAHRFEISILMLLTILPATQVNAESRFTLFLGVEETYLKEKRAGEHDSGFVTVIAPGFNYLLTAPSADLSLSYAFESVHYSSLDRSDRDQQNLSLIGGIIHRPGRWRSEVFGNIEQTNRDIDGIQNISDNVFNDDSREVRTVGADTLLTGNWGSTVKYQSKLGVDVVDVEDGEETEGANLGLAVDNFRSVNNFTWRSALDSQVTRENSDESQIDRLEVNLNYRFNIRWQAFTDLTTWETDVDELDEDRYLIGVLWTPKSNTSVRLSAGEFGDDETYSLDAKTSRRNMQLTAKYTEEITSARAESLTELNQNLLGTSATQSFSIDPVLQQRAEVGFALEGIRSTFGINLFDYVRDPIVAREKETGNGIELRFSRRLSRLATLGVDVLGQRTELTQTSDLVEVEVFYDRSLGKDIDLNINLIFSKQHSSLSANEFEQAQLGFSVLARF